MTQKGRVSPFGDPRIKGCSPLPAAFRSVPRPSSPLSAKASTKCPYALDPKPAAACRDKSPARPRASIRHSALHLPAWPTPAAPCPGPKSPTAGNPRHQPVAFLSTMSKIRGQGSEDREQNLPRDLAQTRWPRTEIKGPFRPLISVLRPLPRWWSRPESNRRPPACKAGALPAELRPQDQMSDDRGQGSASSDT